MNKKDFINKLSLKTNIDLDKCEKINLIIEDTLLIGRKNKITMVTRFIDELGFSKSEAEKIYNISMEILAHGLKDKLLHPFK